MQPITLRLKQSEAYIRRSSAAVRSGGTSVWQRLQQQAAIIYSGKTRDTAVEYEVDLLYGSS